MAARTLLPLKPVTIAWRTHQLLLWLSIAVAPMWGQQDVITLASPNGEIVYRMAMMAPPTEELTLEFPAYQVDFRGQRLIDTSFIQFQLYEMVPLGGKLGLVSETRAEVDESYTLPLGKASMIRNHYNSVELEFLQNGTQGRRLNLEVRAYDDGVAWRYEIPRTVLTDDVRLVGEVTQFNFAKDGRSWPLVVEDYQTSYEDQYVERPLSSIHDGDLVAMPFLVEQPGVGWVAITEADIQTYPNAYLYREEGTTFVTDLSPQLDGSGFVLRARAPIVTPWRVLMIGDTPGELMESNLVTNLNPPSEIEDTSWIKAGKALTTDWARSEAIAGGLNTEGLREYLDFAADNRIEYVMLDENWAASSLTGDQRDVADITEPISEIDMEELLRYAGQRDVGIWLSADWAAIDAQMERAFALYEQWGVKGVEIGGMNRDDSWMVDWYRRVAAAAAEHHLMLALHDSFKPDGLRRTYPNVLTREGVLGSDYSKWSAQATPEHNVTLAFTRMLAGPMDYGLGGFRQATAAEFVADETRPQVLGTRAHQLALYVVFESPLQRVVDDPETYSSGVEDFEFVRDVPVRWDETLVLGGELEEYVAVARRSGDEWFLGAIAGEHGHTLQLSLNFLKSGTWSAEVYRDGLGAESDPTATVVERLELDASSELALRLVQGGGAAVRFSPRR